MLAFMRRHIGPNPVPTLCDAPNLEPFGSCRVCSVEVALQEDGPAKVMASCHSPVGKGMYITTNSARMERLRKRLIEVTCTASRFSSSDYRQLAIYWLLSYAAAIEGRGTEWKEFVLFNPRSGARVRFDFDQFLSVISSGRTKVDILLLFQSLVGSRMAR